MHPSLTQRKIIHVDMDAFYASVECMDQPELVGKPLVVGGKERGVVAAASYAARKFGIRSAMPMKRALALCPDLVVVPPRFTRYREISQQVMKIFLHHTTLVEPLSLDEAYLDVTEVCKNGTLAKSIAENIRALIRQDIGLTASAGVGPNKLVAKIASDHCKPNGLKVVAPQAVAEFMRLLPIEKIHGVGPVTARGLKSRGIHTCADVLNTDMEQLKIMFGVRTGEWLWWMAQGVDDREVSPERETKSIGAETTFVKDLVTWEEKAAALEELAADIFDCISRKQLAALTVTLKIRYPDFTTLTRSSSYPVPVCSKEHFLEAGTTLLAKVPEEPVRLLGLSLSRFSKLSFASTPLF